jgi:hypothetical protein
MRLAPRSQLAWRNRSLTTVITAAGLVMVVLAAGCSSGTKTVDVSTPTTAAGSTRTIGGYVRLHTAIITKASIISSGCVGVGDFADMVPGAQVTVTDEYGKVIASGSLGGGYDEQYRVEDGDRSTHCTFGFSVREVPDAKSYVITVAHRPAVRYTVENLTDHGWQTAFDFG